MARILFRSHHGQQIHHRGASLAVQVVPQVRAPLCRLAADSFLSCFQFSPHHHEAMVLGCLALHFCASLCKTAHLPCQFLWQVSAEQEVRTEQWVGGFQTAVRAPCSKPSHDSTLPRQHTCGVVSPCLAASRRRQPVAAPRHDSQPTQTHSQSVCKI